MIPRFLASVLVLCLFFVSFDGFCGGEEVLARAQGLIEKGKLKEAERLISSNMGRCKEDCYLFQFFFGNVLYMEGKKQDALKHFEASLRLKPSFVDALVNSGRVSFELKMFDKSATFFLRAYRISKKPVYLYLSSVSCIYKKDCSTAYSQLKELIGDFGTSKKEWLDAFAYSASCSREIDDAIGFLRGLPRKDPYAWKTLARLCMQKGNYHEALKFYKVYSYCVPSMKKDDLKAMAGLYAAEGLFLDAARLYESLGMFKKAGISYLSSHDYLKAASSFKRCAKKDPECLFLMGNAYYEASLYSKALGCYLRSAGSGYRSGESYVMVGYCELSMGNTSKALSFFKKASGFKGTKKKALEMIKLLEKGGGGGN